MLSQSSVHAAGERNSWRCWLALLALSAVVVGGTGAVWAQGTRADFARGVALAQRTEGKVTNTVPSVMWMDGARLWYVVELGGGARRYVEVNAETGEKRDLFDAQKVAAWMTKELGRPVEASRLAIERVHVAGGAVTMLMSGTTRVGRIDQRSGELSEVAIEDAGEFLLEGSSASRRGASTAIIVKNRTDADVEMFWINGDSRTSYGKVAAGEVRRQHTFGGHRWAIVRGDGSAAFEGEAVDLPSVVIVNKADGGEKGDAPKQRNGPKRDREPESEQSAGRSPERAEERRALVRESNVVLVERDQERALTKDGTASAGYAGPVVWSPDRTRFVVRWVTPAQKRPVTFVESSPKDQIQPRVHTFDYLKPGDVIELSKPRLFDAESGAEIAVSDELFATPWAIDRLEWAPDSTGFSFVYNQRGHQVMRLVGVSRDGAVRAITEEKPDTFVDYVNSTYVHRVKGTGETIWMSERDGWRHLYLLHEWGAKAGAAAKQITRGEWVVRGVDLVDEEKRQIWFRAGGVHAGQDPYFIHYARINFDGTGLTVLTDGDGTHTVTYSPDRRFLIDRYSRVDMPGVVELRSTETGSLVCELERADWSSLVQLPWTPPERFVAKGRDGKTDIYGVIVRPTNFDAAKKYPVIENIYAGPHSAFVPKEFDAHMGTMQDLAELGFVVVQIDGMGTAHRSKAFHDVCWKNIGDSGFADRIAWLRGAAKVHGEMDLARVGIFGGSAGGQNALRGMLAHGDFYKVAVADCGCHDNRMDKIWWNEAWMGWPIGEHYAEQSNVTNAHRLTGKLLLVVGEMDRNVDPASTMQVASALIKADKDFDLLVMPGVGHGAAESPYGRRRRADFLVRHLLGVEPRAQ